MTPPHAPEPILRRPTEADHQGIAAVIDEWFGGQRMTHVAGRSWFRHVGSSSWIAVDADGQPAGILLGYRSQDHPDEAVIHLVAVDPNGRRRGLGRRLVDAFVADQERAGTRTVVALAWPGEPPSVAFFRALGFRPTLGPGTQNLYGTPAHPDHEAPGDDRILFERRIRS